jgi:hypothetical protein
MTLCTSSMTSHKKENQFYVTRSHTTLKTNVNIEHFLYTLERQMFIEEKKWMYVVLERIIIFQHLYIL